ncbi:FkbM family methyltransferase [Wenxinia marina]|uniref:FkbM family methyltransferase n=1 Tax=Wenxinia marina TaxID=390641 RepID=UPI000366546B|nr:FkbM family methyltransferase [Wenxinia marina]GGL78936.1 hypothetical protein GCM10011392_36770 [Wenxinia marina]
MTLISDADFAREAKARGFVRRTSPRRAIEALAPRADLIVDVGVHTGTKWLYDAFPDLPFLLVDPQRGCEAALKERPARYEFAAVGLSDRTGRMELFEQAANSTFHIRTALSSMQPTGARYGVEVTTFDDLLDARAPGTGRLGVKIDVEGHELAVIRGLERHAPRVSFLVCEISVLDRFEDTPAFAEVIGALAARGLRFYNLMNPVTPKPRRHVDALFLRDDDSAFRGG